MKAKDLKVGEEYAAKAGIHSTASRVKVLDATPRDRYTRGDWAWSSNRFKSTPGILVEVLGSGYGAVSAGDGFQHAEQGRKLNQAVIPPSMFRRTWAEHEAAQKVSAENDARLAREREARDRRLKAAVKALQEAGIKTAREDCWQGIRVELEDAETLASRLGKEPA